MNVITRETLQQLLAQKPAPCLSIYMPTHRTGQAVRQDPIRFKNMLKSAETDLKEYGLKDKEINSLLDQARSLIDDHFFWSHQSDGLAIFSSADNFLHFRLPYPFEEFCTVAAHFHLKPLLPLLSTSGQFYILALDLKNIKLYQATRFNLTEVELQDVPLSLEKYLEVYDFERQTQFHSEAPMKGQSGRQVQFHGHGVGTDDANTKKYIVQYFHSLNKSVNKSLERQNIPLLTIGTDYLLPMYRESNSYANLLESGIAKDPKSFSNGELHRAAWETIEPMFRQDQENALQKYHGLIGSGRASGDLKDVIPAAYNGRIDTLFLSYKDHVWGFFDPNSQEVSLSDPGESGSDDLLDFAALHTVLNDGSVFTLNPEDMPPETSLAAVYRY
ncbi:MAG: hypothetical protein WAN36_16850 [Calditrichia bacterium]